MCVCRREIVCVCVCVRERGGAESAGKRERARERVCVGECHYGHRRHACHACERQPDCEGRREREREYAATVTPTAGMAPKLTGLYRSPRMST